MCVCVCVCVCGLNWILVYMRIEQLNNLWPSGSLSLSFYSAPILILIISAHLSDSSFSLNSLNQWRVARTHVPRIADSVVASTTTKAEWRENHFRLFYFYNDQLSSVLILLHSPRGYITSQSNETNLVFTDSSRKEELTRLFVFR